MVTRGKATPPTLSDTQRAYMAGLVDGEGSISVMLIRKSQTARGGVPLWFRPVVKIASTTPVLIEPFTTFGGVLRVAARRMTRGNEVWDWVGFDRRAEICCRALHEFLVLKKPLARLLLDFYDERLPYRYGGVRLPREEIDRRLEIIRAMRRLTNSGRPEDEERFEARVTDLLSCYPQRLSERAPVIDG